MIDNSYQSCTLCEDNPQEGMHLTGKKVLNGEMVDYTICKKCCLANFEYDENGVNRQKLWALVDEKLNKTESA